MTDARDVFTLWPEGLMSRWGFQDGDVIHQDDDFWDYANEHGVDLLTVERDWLLLAVVQTFIVPVVDQVLDVFHMETQHNPVRTRTVDGHLIDHRLDEDDQPVHLTPREITVPYADVLALARELQGTESNLREVTSQ